MSLNCSGHSVSPSVFALEDVTITVSVRCVRRAYDVRQLKANVSRKTRGPVVGQKQLAARHDFVRFIIQRAQVMGFSCQLARTEQLTCLGESDKKRSEHKGWLS